MVYNSIEISNISFTTKDLIDTHRIMILIIKKLNLSFTLRDFIQSYNLMPSKKSIFEIYV